LPVSASNTEFANSHNACIGFCPYTRFVFVNFSIACINCSPAALLTALVFWAGLLNLVAAFDLVLVAGGFDTTTYLLGATLGAAAFAFLVTLGAATFTVLATATLGGAFLFCTPPPTLLLVVGLRTA